MPRSLEDLDTLLSEIRVYDRDTFICVAVDEDHPNVRLSLRDIESARRPAVANSAKPSRN